MHALCRIEPPEGHLHPGTDGQGGRIDVGHLAPVAAATIEVDDGPDERWREAEGQVVDGVGGHRASHVGQALRLHLVDRSARQAYPGGRQVHETAHRAPTGREPELPELVAAHGRGVGSLRVRTPRRLPTQLAAPREEQCVRRGPTVRRPSAHRAKPVRRRHVGHGRRGARPWSGAPLHQPRPPLTRRRSPDPARPARARPRATRRPGRPRGSRCDPSRRPPADRPPRRAPSARRRRLGRAARSPPDGRRPRRPVRHRPGHRRKQARAKGTSAS